MLLTIKSIDLMRTDRSSGTWPMAWEDITAVRWPVLRCFTAALFFGDLPDNSDKEAFPNAIL